MSGTASARRKLFYGLPEALAWAHVLSGDGDCGVCIDFAELAKHALAAGFREFADLDRALLANGLIVTVVGEIRRLERYREAHGQRAALISATARFGFRGRVLCSVLAPYNNDCPPCANHVRIRVTEEGIFNLDAMETRH